MKLRINEEDTLMKYKTYGNVEKCFNILVNKKGYSKEEAQDIIDHMLADYKYNSNSTDSLLRRINLVLPKDEYEKEYGITERCIRLKEKETPNIEVKHEGILEVPEGKNVNDLPLSHFVNLANKKGLSKITKALNNLQVWNKNDDPKLSKWAGNMIDKLNKKLKKDESLIIKEDNATRWDIWTETDYSLFIDGKRVKYPKYTTDRYGNYPMMVLPRYNNKTDTLSWCLYVDDGNGEMKLIEDQFVNSYEAMDAGEDYYSRYLKKDESLTIKEHIFESGDFDKYKDKPISFNDTDSRKLEEFICQKLDENSLWVSDVSVDKVGNKVCIDVEIKDGDWKHEHLRLDYLMFDILYEYNPKLAYNYFKVDEEITDEDGSDTYSAIHKYVIEL